METTEDYRYPEEMATEVRLDMVVGQHVIHAPAEVRVSRPGMIEWRLPMRSVAPKRKNIAADFVALEKASDEEIAEFVRNYGFIGAETLPVLMPGSKPYKEALTSDHSLREFFAQTVDSDEWTKQITAHFDPSASVAVPVSYQEPTEVYRTFARRVSAILQVAAAIAEGRSANYDDYCQALNWPEVKARVSKAQGPLGALIEQFKHGNDTIPLSTGVHEDLYREIPTFATKSVLEQTLNFWISITTRVWIGREGQVSISGSAALHPNTTRSLISDDVRNLEECVCHVPSTIIESQILHRFSCLLPVGLAVVNALYDPIPRCARCSRAFPSGGRKVRDDRRKFCSKKCSDEHHRANMKDYMRNRRSRKKEA